MIQINCNNCKALLQIDDAFAGGVCRCRYCGTIQTVPKHLKQPAGGEQATVSAAATATGGKAKTLYRSRNAARGEALGGSGSGLDELANIVASSGLASARLTKAAAQPPPEAPGGIDRKTLIIVSAAGVIILLLLVVIIVLATRGRNPQDNRGGNPAMNEMPGGEQVMEPSTPTFLGQTLEGNVVAFVLDRGSSAAEEGRLELVKGALLRTLEGFGEGRLFQVVFWEVDGEVWSFPKDGAAPANRKNLDDLRAALEHVNPGGQTRVDKAIRKAVESKPDTIVLIPVKILLDDDFDQVVKRELGNSRANVYAFSLWQDNLGNELREIAGQTAGAYRDVSPNNLRAAARQ